jgi:hypothetical protein
MTSKTDFSDEEWERLGRAPLVAALAITLADPGGPIETVKESHAALNTIVEAARDGGYGEFVQAVARDVAARAQHRENPMAGFKPDRDRPVDTILDELRAVYALLLEKADAADVDGFREWLRQASQRAALAAKEGGVLGFGGRRVSEREQQMLETLGEVFGAERSTPPSP